MITVESLLADGHHDGAVPLGDLPRSADVDIGAEGRSGAVAPVLERVLFGEERVVRWKGGREAAPSFGRGECGDRLHPFREGSRPEIAIGNGVGEEAGAGEPCGESVPVDTCAYRDGIDRKRAESDAVDDLDAVAAEVAESARGRDRVGDADQDPFGGYADVRVDHSGLRGGWGQEEKRRYEREEPEHHTCASSMAETVKLCRIGARDKGRAGEMTNRKNGKDL
jgi:hypothetical protein